MVNSNDALLTALYDAGVTCIKLAPIVYQLLGGQAKVYRVLAIVAEEGQATLDGEGTKRLLWVQPGADVALGNLILTNGQEKYGGAAFVEQGGVLVADNCVFKTNTAKEVRLSTSRRILIPDTATLAEPVPYARALHSKAAPSTMEARRQ